MYFKKQREQSAKVDLILVYLMQQIEAGANFEYVASIIGRHSNIVYNIQVQIEHEYIKRLTLKLLVDEWNENVLNLLINRCSAEEY